MSSIESLSTFQILSLMGFSIQLNMMTSVIATLNPHVFYYLLISLSEKEVTLCLAQEGLWRDQRENHRPTHGWALNCQYRGVLLYLPPTVSRWRVRFQLHCPVFVCVCFYLLSSFRYVASLPCRLRCINACLVMLQASLWGHSSSSYT